MASIVGFGTPGGIGRWVRHTRWYREGSHLMAGCRIVRDNRAAVKSKVAAFAEKILSEVTTSAIAEMKAAAPEKSGKLRRMIASRRLSRFRRRLQSGAKHSAIIEFGSHNTPPRPFFYPAYFRARIELMRRVKQFLGR